MKKNHDGILSIENNNPDANFLRGDGFSEYELLCSIHREMDMAAAINLVFERLHAQLKNFLSTCDNAKLSCDPNKPYPHVSPVEFINNALSCGANIPCSINLPSIFNDKTRDVEMVAACALDIYPRAVVDTAIAIHNSGKLVIKNSDGVGKANISNRVSAAIIAAELVSIPLKNGFVINHVDAVESYHTDPSGCFTNARIVADTLNRTLNNHLSFTIKDGKCKQLHDVLNAVIATMNYSEEVNQFDLFFIIENIEKHFDIEPLKKHYNLFIDTQPTQDKKTRPSHAEMEP